MHNRSVTESCARALLGLMFGLLAYAIFRLVPVDTSHRDLLTMVAMSAVAAVMVHRVYASHNGAVTPAQPDPLVLVRALLLVPVGNTLRASDPHALGRRLLPITHRSPA